MSLPVILSSILCLPLSRFQLPSLGVTSLPSPGYPRMPALAVPLAPHDPIPLATPAAEPTHAYAAAAIISLGFRSIGFAGVAFVLGMPGFASDHTLASVGSVWLAAEGFFYAYCLVTSSLMSVDRSFIQPPLQAERRQQLWTSILQDPTQSPRTFVEDWFFCNSGPDRVVRGGVVRALFDALTMAEAEPPKGKVRYTELRRADVLHWLACGLFETPLSQLSAAERKQLEVLVDQLEAKAGPLRPSNAKELNADESTAGVASMRPALEPVQWLHRPLAYYMLTHVLYGELFTRLDYGRAGFVRRSHGSLTYYVRDERNRAVMTRTPVGRRASQAATPMSQLRRQLPEWMESRPPAIVFIHGVGVGPGPYRALLEQIAAADGAASRAEAPVCMALQVEQFCQRIVPSRPASPPEFAAAFEALLDAHGLERAVVVGHSLGTAYTNYLLRYAPARVAATALIDPICCMLHHARITNAFVYEPVASLRVAVEEYYIRRELFTSNVIARYCRWHEASLWPTSCSPATPTLIVLSEDDKIVPVDALRACATSWTARARGVRVLRLPGLGHGGWLLEPSACAEIATRVRGLARK